MKKYMIMILAGILSMAVAKDKPAPKIVLPQKVIDRLKDGELEHNFINLSEYKEFMNYTISAAPITTDNFPDDYERFPEKYELFLTKNKKDIIKIGETTEMLFSQYTITIKTSNIQAGEYYLIALVHYPFEKSQDEAVSSVEKYTLFRKLDFINEFDKYNVNDTIKIKTKFYPHSQDWGGVELLLNNKKTKDFVELPAVYNSNDTTKTYMFKIKNMPNSDKLYKLQARYKNDPFSKSEILINFIKKIIIEQD